RVEAAEVEEAQRLAVHGVAALVRDDVALEEVPVGDVVPRVAKYPVVEVARHEVDDSLVDEELLLGRQDRVEAEQVAPPVEERTAARADRHAAEVEDARAEDVDLARTIAVARERPQRVRCEHDPVLLRKPAKLVER